MGASNGGSGSTNSGGTNSGGTSSGSSNNGSTSTGVRSTNSKGRYTRSTSAFLVERFTANNVERELYTEEEEDINSQDKTSSPDDSSSVGSMLIRHSTQDSRPLALSGVQMHESDVHVYRSERKLIQQMIGQPRKERRKTRCTYIQSIHHCVALTLALKSGVSVMIHEKNAMKKKKKQTCVGISEGSVPVPVLCLGSRTSNVLTKRA